MRQSTRIHAAVLTILVPVAVLSTACAAGESDAGGQTPQAVDTEAEAGAIMALEAEWSNRFSAGDVDWIMNLQAENAVQLPPDAEIVVGAKALRALEEDLATTDGLEASWESTFARVSPSGDMAYDYGTASMTTPDGDTHAMKYLVVWVREDGEWKVAADMYNANKAN